MVNETGNTNRDVQILISVSAFDRLAFDRTQLCLFLKNLSYRRRTVRRALSVEILSAAAQLYKNRILKGVQYVDDGKTPYVTSYLTSL